MSNKFAFSFALGVLVLISGIGNVYAQQPAGTADAAKHMHPTHGPHSGELLEIGKEEFHAELVVDESKKQMTIYLLEKDAKTSLAIEAPYLAVNLILAGKPVQIRLKSMPQDADPKALSSRFAAASAELIDALHSPKADLKLALRIRNKAYVTKIVHKHDHSDHNHAQKPAGSLQQKR